MIHHRILRVCILFLLLLPLSGRDFYWESPESVASSDSRFPSSATNGTVSAVVWHDVESKDKDSGLIWLSGRVYDGSRWYDRPRFAGPFSYAGEVPSIASVTIDRDNRILVPVASAFSDIAVMVSSDLGASFNTYHLDGRGQGQLAPRIFVRSDGGYFLFAARGTEDNFIMVFSRSDNAAEWQPIAPFGPASGRKRAFIPSHASDGSNDVVVFQAFHEGERRSSYQLYSTVSRDKGSSWSDAALITNFGENPSIQDEAVSGFTNYHNQRARLLKINGTISLVWERSRTMTEKYAIWYASLNAQGSIVGNAELVSSTDGYCYDPDLISLDQQPVVVWFDNRRGVNRVYMARKEGFLWTETDLSRGPVDSVFARIVPTAESLEVYWQENRPRGVFRIARLAPDHSVQPPKLIAVNFAAGKKSRGDLVRFSVALPEDSSGIAGYSLESSAFRKPDVPAEIQYLPSDVARSFSVDYDASWIIGVRAVDYAGNWSEPAYLEYIRDTTPPLPPTIVERQKDSNGYLVSNDITLEWTVAEPDDIAGFTWNFEYVASLDYLPRLAARSSSSTQVPISRSAPALFDFQSEAAKAFTPKKPDATVRSATPSVSFANQDNGIYALSVSTVDSVGNISRPSIRYYALNKYIPVTYITYVDAQTDESGSVSLSLVGRGFSHGGPLDEILIDRDGVEPWDLRLRLQSGQYKIVNDRLVEGITLRDLDEGAYRVIVSHPLRGRHASRNLLSVSESGTVKFGDFRHVFTPPWTIAEPLSKRSISPAMILLLSVMVFALLVSCVSLYGLSVTARETIFIRQEVVALITGESMSVEKKKRSVALRKRGMGLRFKLAFFTTTLVISVVLIVSIPIGIRFSANQERTLAKGLESRVQVLLESLSSGARAYLPSQNILELGFLPGQMSALEEARYATITGGAIQQDSTGIDNVWATNDPDIESKIDSGTYTPGRSRITGGENDDITAMVAVLDAEAERTVGELSRGISDLTQEGIKLALKTDSESVRRRDEIQVISRQLEEKLNRELTRLSASGTGSYPRYDPDALSRDTTSYVFYKPVLYRSGSDSRYVRGTVRVEISTLSLLEAVNKDRQELVQTTFYIALFAVLMGVIGALVLASIIISPVRRLAVHVAMIRDTEDKEELEGKELSLKTKDEIGLLGETINDMTRGLVKAAAASKDLTVGKEVQKMFIPLETDDTGRKLTCGSTVDDHAEFFGYYEGAKGVSGDYFDYIKLDDRHYAIIKCDVAGKGVPAALIMVEVATLFLDFFKDWKYERNGYRLEIIVSKINDLIESRGFKGRFAAFTLCIFDSASGMAHFCNAGDNLVHRYSASRGKMEVITLPESSAAGVFPSFMIDMKGGFQVVSTKLDKGDVLFLYTDGIEEAKRLFRTPSLEVYTCAESGLELDAPHGNHSVGQDNEEIGPDRVNAIIEAVLSRKRYALQKWHNPEGEVTYEFDFSDCQGTIEEAILALVSVEKVFRMYLDGQATDFDRVQVDRRVDRFLSAHFLQYERYCSQRRDHPEYGEYLYYTNVKEDAQYDDLTILAVQKK